MENNYCVIMGGGIGSRFWPFSKEEYPKQFLDFFGNGRSLIQMTVDRFARIIPVENIYIVTNVKYAALVKEQLPELPCKNILLEPARLNTAPCIAYASYHIRAINPAANIVVAPSDHLILKEDVFLADIAGGLEFVARHPALVTLGIKPCRAETGYGYIQSSDIKQGSFSKVKTFIEKPDADLAKVLFESGEFFWNSGVFLWNVNTIIEAFGKYLPDVSSNFEQGATLFNTPGEDEFIREAYPRCPSISIDHAIMESADNVYVMCVDFGWADLGTWGSLYDLSQRKDEHGNALLRESSVHLYESTGNLIAIDDPDSTVVIEGLHGYIVARSGSSLLICRKDNEQRIRKFVSDLEMRQKKN
jgi:mannose-1-phosphate guanylyltransferase